MNEKTSEQLVGGGFAYMTAPFAVHALDKERAREWRAAIKREGKGWPDAEAQVRSYLAKQGCTAELIEEEVARVRKFLGVK